MEPLKIMTWLWKQQPDPHGYDAEKVNVWAAMLRRHLTIPHTLACVTDMPAGIDTSIEIIPLPREFDSVKCAGWREKSGAPQCYRRLTMFASDAAKRFGADRWISMDLDVVICKNVDSVFNVKDPLKFYKGTSSSRPYNGSLMHITAGHRPHVYDRFSQEGAAAARKKYIGSDQAWISYALGWTEPVWNERDGVYFYTKGFATKYLRGAMRPPPGLRMLFFPGKPKPWDLLADPWFREHWSGETPVTAYAGKPAKPRRTPATTRPSNDPRSYGKKSGRFAPPKSEAAPLVEPDRAAQKLWAFRGPKGWAEKFQAACMLSNVPCRLFDDPAGVPNGARAFVRLDQQGGWRDRTRGVVEQLAKRGVITLPTLREARWYDDKVAQHETLKQWMPETRIFRDEIEAMSAAPALEYPLVSKSTGGASSTNVRLLRSADEAMGEARQSFSGGLSLPNGRTQAGYVYWQRLVPDQSCDYRVIVAGEVVFGVVRSVRAGDFRASGSGNWKPLSMASERERRATYLALEISDAIGTKWMAYDFVFDANRPLVLEMSSSWLMSAYTAIPLFDRRSLHMVGGDYMAEAVRILQELPGA